MKKIGFILSYVILFPLLFAQGLSAQTSTQTQIIENIDNKTFQEIQAELRAIKDNINTALSNLSIGLKAEIIANSVDKYEAQYIENFAINNKINVINESKRLSDESNFFQVFDKDSIQLIWRFPYSATRYAYPYKNLELKDPEIYLEAIDFYDGTSLLYKEHDHPLYTDSISVVDGRKKINNAHLVLEYQHIKEAKKISLDRENRTSTDKKIQLS